MALDIRRNSHLPLGQCWLCSKMPTRTCRRRQVQGISLPLTWSSRISTQPSFQNDTDQQFLLIHKKKMSFFFITTEFFRLNYWNFKFKWQSPLLFPINDDMPLEAPTTPKAIQSTYLFSYFVFQYRSNGYNNCQNHHNTKSYLSVWYFFNYLNINLSPIPSQG